MPPVLTHLLRVPAVGALGSRDAIGGCLIGVLHGLALAAMGLTEFGPFAQVVFILVWIALNGALLTGFGRPAISAALALMFIIVIIMLSEFKISIVSMGLHFFDIWIIDPDTLAFLFATFPDLRWSVLLAALAVSSLLVLIWRLDPFRIPRWRAAAVAAASLTGFIGLSAAVPNDPEAIWLGTNHVSTFARSGVSATSSLLSHGWIDFDRATPHRPLAVTEERCTPKRKPPHVIMVLDEGSFDITAIPGVRVPAGYSSHFRSFDGKARQLFVEGIGGPTWYTEYNVLTGLSVHSYGGISYNATQIAAGHVQRGLPQALRRCGYKTVTLYPAYGAFLGARAFQTGTGVERFLDYGDLKQVGNEPDSFFYERALRILAEDNKDQPLFIFVYTVVNHFPWSHRFRPDLTPDWQNLNADPEIDEYVRRQVLGAGDFASFMDRLRRDFPGEAFLVARFGDHQPSIAKPLIDATIATPATSSRMPPDDLRYYTTYYALDAINFRPAELASAMQALDAPYLPLVVLEAAGLPLDASFAEQKRILQRCGGLFYRCDAGAEARRLNRLLIDAGLIKGLTSR